MRKVLLGVAALGLVATAWAGPTRIDPGQVHLTPLTGSVTNSFSNGNVSGFQFQPDPGQAIGGQRFGVHVYDNIPTWLGGTGTPGSTVAGLPATWLYVDWVSTTAAWGDDLHGMVPSGVVTHMTYIYFNSVGTSTHLIKFAGMTPPSNSHSANTIPTTLVSPIASFLVGPLPFSTAGGFIVTITGLSIHVSTAAWVSLNDPMGAGAWQSFWLTGGIPGIGSSHDGVLWHTVYSGYPYWVPGPFLFIPPTVAVHANVVLGLGIPEPATISALALAGLLVLRRRRA